MQTKLRQYNAAATVTLRLRDYWTTDFYDTALAEGDVQISKDDGAWANVGTLATKVQTNEYQQTLTGAELTAARITLRIADQTDPKAFIDLSISIETFGHASAQIVTDLSAFGAEVTGIKTVTDVIPDAGAMTSVATASGISGLDGKIDTITAYEVAILEDTGTTLNDKLDVIDGIVDAILVDTGTTLLDLLEADRYLDTTGDPWTLEVRRKGTATALLTKELYTVAGDNVNAATDVIGRHTEE